MSGKKAVVIGATGLVGKQLIRLMIKDERYDKITLISRKSHEIKDPKLVEVLIKDFSDLREFQSKMDGHDFYCALGTTRKQAGSKEAFLKVDVEYPLEFAKIAKSQPSFEQLLVVTAVGANSHSPLFYNMAKGQLEDHLQALKLRALKIFQPSLLLGKRDKTRFIEEVAKLFSAIASFFTIASKKRVGAIRDVEVAKAMLEVARKEEQGFNRYKPGQMVDIAYAE